MLSFEYNNTTVEINNAFCEGVIKAVSIKEDILEDPVQKRVVTQVMEQENDGTGYYSLVFTVTDEYRSGMGGHPSYLVRACVPKEDVTVLKKLRVRFKESSSYVRFNDDYEFMEELSDFYSKNKNAYVYYLPFSYDRSLFDKYEEYKMTQSLRLDIPYNDLEEY